MLNVSSSRLFNQKEQYGKYALIEFLLAAVLAIFRKSIVNGFDQHAALNVVVTAILFGLALGSLVHIVLSLMARKWDAWFSLLSAILIFFLTQVIAALALGLYASFTNQTSSIFDNSVTGQFVYTLITETLVVASIIGYARYFKIALSDLAIRRPRWTDPLFGLTAVVPYFVLFAIVETAVAHLIPSFNASQHQEIGFDNVHGNVQLLFTFLSVVVLAPIAEETMFRGLLYSSLKRALPVVWATIVTSLIFATAHLPEGGSSGPLYIAALDTFILSLVLVVLREKTNSLWPGITLHASKNFIAFMALFVLHAH